MTQKERGDDTKFSIIDLTNSAMNQSGFILKVVIKGIIIIIKSIINI